VRSVAAVIHRLTGRGRAAAPLLVLAGAGLLAGCSTASAGTTTTTRPAASSTTTTTLPPRYVVVGGKRVEVPSERDNVPIHASTDEGQQVIIEAHGFVPRVLYAMPTASVVWTNLTNKTQRITLDNGQVHSGPIPPGGKFVWNYHRAISFRYTSASGLVGFLYDGTLVP